MFWRLFLSGAPWALHFVFAPAFGACSWPLLPTYDPRMLTDPNRPGAATLPAQSVLEPETRLQWRRLIQETPDEDLERGTYRLAFRQGELALSFRSDNVALTGLGTFGVEPYVWKALERDLPPVLVATLKKFMARVERVLIQPGGPHPAQGWVMRSENLLMLQVWTEDRRFEEALQGHSHSHGFNVIVCELGCATLVRPDGSHGRGPVIPAPPWLALWKAWHQTPAPTRSPRLILSASVIGNIWPR